MRFGICASMREVAALKAIPFDYLEESVQRFLVPEAPREVFQEQLQQARTLPIPVETANVFLPGDLALIATPARSVDHQRIEHYVQTALQRAEESGIRLIVFGSGVARACPESYAHNEALSQLGEYLEHWNIWASRYGVELVLEPLRYEETNIFNTVSETGAFVASLNASHVRLLADTYHMACNGEAPETLIPAARNLAHVHVAEHAGRSAPGRHNEDLRPYFRALHQAGYDSRISIECNWDDIATQIAPAFETLREQWASSVPR